MDINENYHAYFVIKKQFPCNIVLLLRSILPRITQKCVCGDKTFLSTISLKRPSPINCVLHNNLEIPTFGCSIYASPHQSMVDYTGHFMTYVILSILSIV